MMKIFFIIFVLVAHSACAADCASGYTWNSETGKCEITCDAGYYVATAGGTCVPFPGNYDNYYIDTSHTVVYGDTTPSSLKKKCPCTSDGCGYVPSYYDGSSSGRINATIENCIVDRCGLRYVMDRNLENDNDILYNTISSTHGVGCAPCYYNSSTSNSYGTPIFNRCVGGSWISTCDGGFWTDTQSIGNALTYHPCNPVGVDYYSPDGDVNRYPCPDGTISGGFGAGADDISDCVPYKTLYVDGAVPVKMPTTLHSEHAFGTNIGGVNYYGKATTKFLLNHVHFDLGDGIVYTIINPLDEFDYYDYAEYPFYSIP